MEGVAEQTPAQAPAESSEPVTDAPERSEDPQGQDDRPEIERGEDGRILSREAAGYRRRLRDAEAERDALAERLDRVQRAEVERLASGAGLAVAGDVWLHGATLETLRTEDGDIDHEVVTGLVADIIKDRPGLKAPMIGSGRLGEGSTAAGRLGGRQTPGLSDLLKPGRG